jgi:hypothetical protein
MKSLPPQDVDRITPLPEFRQYLAGRLLIRQRQLITFAELFNQRGIVPVMWPRDLRLNR